MLIPAQNDDDMDARSANDEESWHQSYDEQARGHKYDGNADNGKTGNHEHKWRSRWQQIVGPTIPMAGDNDDAGAASIISFFIPYISLSLRITRRSKARCVLYF